MAAAPAARRTSQPSRGGFSRGAYRGAQEASTALVRSIGVKSDPGPASGEASIPRQRDFPQPGVKLPRPFPSAMSQIDPPLPSRRRDEKKSAECDVLFIERHTLASEAPMRYPDERTWWQASLRRQWHLDRGPLLYEVYQRADRPAEPRPPACYCSVLLELCIRCLRAAKSIARINKLASFSRSVMTCPEKPPRQAARHREYIAC